MGDVIVRNYQASEIEKLSRFFERYRRGFPDAKLAPPEYYTYHPILAGGQNVFLVRPDDLPNMNQMIDAVSRDGYVIAQEYLPKAADGDLRLFMINGQPLRYKGKYAAFQRIREGGDMRSNIHAGERRRRQSSTTGS